MAEADLQRFLHKVEQLKAFVALSEADPDLRRRLRDCSHHNAVVELARDHGFEIGRRWGEPLATEAERCPPAGTEHISVLQQGPGWRLERIHSCQASSPAQGWYDQDESEWVTLLQGSATLQFADEQEPRRLRRGEALLIAPHRRHRVVATDPAPGTVWLALFWQAAGAP